MKAKLTGYSIVDVGVNAAQRYHNNLRFVAEELPMNVRSLQSIKCIIAY